MYLHKSKEQYYLKQREFIEKKKKLVRNIVEFINKRDFLMAFYYLISYRLELNEKDIENNLTNLYKSHSKLKEFIENYHKKEGIIVNNEHWVGVTNLEIEKKETYPVKAKIYLYGIKDSLNEKDLNKKLEGLDYLISKLRQYNLISGFKVAKNFEDYVLRREDIVLHLNGNSLNNSNMRKGIILEILKDIKEKYGLNFTLGFDLPGYSYTLYLTKKALDKGYLNENIVYKQKDIQKLRKYIRDSLNKVIFEDYEYRQLFKIAFGEKVYNVLFSKRQS